MAKRGLCILLAVVTLFALAVPAFAAETSGKCGDNVTWSLSGTTITLSGTGATWFYDVPVPWIGAVDQITAVVIKKGVTSISDSLFQDCANLTSVTIPEGVTAIGVSAFGGCGLTSVTIPSSVSSMGAHCFSGCTDLKSVTFADGLTAVGVYMFGGCTGLTSVAIPASVESIKIAAFQGCTGLSGVTISSGVKSIETAAFSGCTKLSGVTVPASVTSIGQAAFGGDSGLKSIKILNPDCDIYTSESDTLGVPGATVISGYDGSTAQAYAKENGYTFKSLGKAPGAATLAAPKLSGASNTATGVKITWKAVSGAAKYQVYYKTTGGWKKAGGTTTKTSYTWTGAKSGTKYTFTVKAYDKAGNAGKYDKTGKSVTYYAAPEVTIAKTSGGIKVSWNKVSGAPRYMVYYKENGGGWKKIGTTTSTSYTRAASKLKSGATYQFTVRCVKNDKTTLLSAYKASNSLKYTAELAAPTVKIALSSNGGIKVSWNKVSGAPRYTVYYKENGGGWKKIGTTTSTSYTRAASKLKSGVTYQFAVRCCDSDKTTLLSGYKASNSLGYYAAPTVTIAKTSGGIKVSWNKISGAPRYAVYYKENGGGWHKIGTTTSTSYTRKAAKLKSGVTYQFTVRCCAADKTTMLSGYTASNSLKYTK